MKELIVSSSFQMKVIPCDLHSMDNSPMVSKALTFYRVVNSKVAGNIDFIMLSTWHLLFTRKMRL